MYRVGRKPALEHQDQPTTADELTAALAVITDAISAIDAALSGTERREDALLDVRLILRPAPVVGRVPVIPGGAQ